MITEIDRVAANAAFNGTKLLDGTFKDNQFQVGSGNDTTDRISISIGSAKASALGVVGATTGTSSASTGAITSGAIAAGDLSIGGFAISASSNDNISYKDPAASAIAKANAINASSSQTNVTAKAQSNVVESAAVTGHATKVKAGDILINGVDLGEMAIASDAAGRAAQLAAAMNAKSSQTGVTAKAITGGKVEMTAADGRNISWTVGSSPAGGVAGFATGDETKYAKITITSTKGDSSLTYAGSSDGAAKVGLSGTVSLSASTVTGQTVSSVDLSSQDGSQKALTILDAAIDTVTNSRANLGAYQNRFEAAISNLETTSTNLQASRSRILDTDYAKETTNLAKSQIVQQAATAMLAQANQSSQSVLALLK